MAFVRGVRIAGSGIAELPRHQTNEELAERLGMTASAIEELTGVRRRYVGAPDLTLPVLHSLACRSALGDGGPPDLIVNASVGFHQLIPDTTVFIQRELGFEGIAGFSMHATCISFLYALQLADAYVRAGVYRRVLITSAELNSRVRNFNEPESASLLGDAGAAVVLEACDDGTRGLEHCSLRTWPEHAELTQVPGFGLGKHPLHEATEPSDYLFTMDGSGVLKAAARLFLVHMTQFFRTAKIDKSEIDLVIPHQPSGSGLRFLERCGFASEKTINILADYGNCAAVSLPLAVAVAHRAGRLGEGTRVLLLGTAAGIGVGAVTFRC